MPEMFEECKWLYAYAGVFPGPLFCLTTPHPGEKMSGKNQDGKSR
jgi:hypothetical protein